MTMKTHEVTILARITKAGNTSSLAAGTVVKTGAGNGTLSAVVVDQNLAVAEDWALEATSATEFDVTGSVSGAQAVATVGTPYVGPISFTLTAGGTAFAAGSKFAFPVALVEDFPFSTHTLVVDEIVIDGVERAATALVGGTRTDLEAAAKAAVGEILSR